jgi:cytochrome c peroxidase
MCSDTLVFPKDHIIQTKNDICDFFLGEGIFVFANKEKKILSLWTRKVLLTLAAFASVGLALHVAHAQSSYAKVDITEAFNSIMARMKAAKPAIEKKHSDLLNERYDLSDRPAHGVFMERDKPVQDGVRVKLPEGMTWEKLASLSPEEIREKNLFPKGFYPLPHPNHPEGGMIFPHYEIESVQKQDGRDLTRFDLDFDLPDHFMPAFPPAIYLTTRPDLGDVSQGKLVTLTNYYETFSGILNPKQLEGVRLLLTPFPQQQYNATEDRRSEKPSMGVACFDCHANGGTNGASHLVGDIRPQEFRHRIETPALRGVNVQRLFGSQRALKTVEDFTEFEQRAAYFDGDPVIAAKKGVNTLDRATQVHAMAEFEELLDFPPAPKLSISGDGKLDPKKATPAELRGQAVFFGKGQCANCHSGAYYTDNLMHDLHSERFFKPVMINGMMAEGDGAIKTLSLRGIKATPPYMHDGRLLTLDDTVEYFNVILGTQLTTQEKKDLVEFLRAL